MKRYTLFILWMVAAIVLVSSCKDGNDFGEDYLPALSLSANGNNGTETDTRTFVDLGLPSGTLWATCNIGASKPEEYGDYFAWGETTGYNSGKTNFSWSTYKYCNGSSFTMTKYCTSSSYGTVDNKTELELADDAAYVNWGSQWRMPSYEQFDELINSSYTTIKWTTQNGVNGRLITSKTNGNSIFLPAAGFRDDASLDNAGSYGYYWSRTLCTDIPYDAYGLYFYSSYVNWGNYDRYYGPSVRPVRASENILVTGITLSQTSLSLSTGGTEMLSVTVSPSNATDQRVTWSSSNTAVATVSTAGLVTAIAAGSCTITCTAQDGSGVKATCSVTVTSGSDSDTHAYVNLGLPSGTLWATCNIGASKPEDYGDYFAWGETTGYNSGKTNFDWSTYKYCKGTSSTLTKYCQESSYGYNGFTDALTELELSDDAAYVNWGSQWRMPSIDQFEELINSSYTTTTWTTQNGVYGCKITSKMSGYTDKSIFLPAAGYRFGTSIDYTGLYGYYWSRTLYPHVNTCDLAYYLRFNSSDVDYYAYDREFGSNVRPVRAPHAQTRR